MRTRLIFGLQMLAMSVFCHAAEPSLDEKVRAFLDNPARSDESKQIIRKVIDTVRVVNGITCKSGLDAELRAFMADPNRSQASKDLVRKVVDELQATMRSSVSHFALGKTMQWYLQHRAGPVIEGCSCKPNLPTDGCRALS